ncbi:MAG: hypothetical protein NZ823_00805 [Blastocatellia bacterium]|nr:hypothetical protein [Blastocatellia bacterium]
MVGTEVTEQQCAIFTQHYFGGGSRHQRIARRATPERASSAILRALTGRYLFTHRLVHVV